ncbi:FtsK/SpoIIIE domain-containing protein [Pseudonocardia lacus]|uniref:FtsK/SpoIIIE domain-containing protein n=1 Tax=Pseudonocardia lacus TaxID=2835865 RepID=UPI001BDD47EF|nr:FtsK/SpoIIIE domain-containing protein [Pseudonocardia lacus]
MRLTVTVIDLVRAGRDDVVVDAPADATVEALAGRLGSGPVPPVLYVDGHPVDPRLPLVRTPIRDGAVVSLDDPAGAAPPHPRGVVELRITGGGQAGVVHPLGTGEQLVGSGPDATVRVADPFLAPAAFTLFVGPDGRCELEVVPGVPARLDGEPPTGRARWPPGAQLAVGGSMFEVATPSRPDAVLAAAPDRPELDYNRPPRVRPPYPPARFRLPQPPRPHERSALPIVTALVPLVVAVVAAVAFRSPAYLLLGLLSPVGVLFNHQVEKRRGRTSHRQRIAEYRERRERIEADARRAFVAERRYRRRAAPDPAQVWLTAVGPRARLWERRRGDDDFLTVRVGTAEVDSEVVLEDPEAPEHRRESAWRMPDVPVTVPLRECGVLGVAGRGTLPTALGRWIVAQVATLHSCLDVRIWVLTESRARRDWEWVRWLPHTRTHDAVHIGNDGETVAQRVAELTAMLVARRQAADNAHGSPSDQADHPDVLVVLDGARDLRALPGVVALLRQGPAVGIVVVCLDADPRRLPAECRAVVTATGAALRVQQPQADPVDQVRPDLVGARWCDRLARALAALRDVSDRGGASELPDRVRLLDVLDLEPPTAEAVTARWLAGGRSTEAVIGVGVDRAYAVDLRRDGPHGLVAGTTGSGKSELLQTLVAALAIANRPDEMTFVLVDYKGGAAFRECAELVHTVGLVTDLDGHLTERALESLAAELHRRERILLRAGTKDIDDYCRLRDADGATGSTVEPMPRLLIVIDEFASLVGELPDFVAGLVDIARRGRSLGVHLLLATQRPAGVVTADIRANTNLRIALRVTDEAESNDVVDAPDAAWIAKSTPGRCLVRSGTSSLDTVQSARVGGRRLPAGPAAAQPLRIVPRPWEQLGRPVPDPPPAASDDGAGTDLAALVEAIREAADTIGVPRPAGPWLPPLPDIVTLDELPGTPEPAPVPFGLTDLPAAQTRAVLALDPARDGHLAVAGSPRSGRSTVLRTVAGSVASRTAPDDVHMYAVDCGANALTPLAELPHCGAVVGRDQPDRMERLLARLSAEVAERQRLLAAAGFAGIAEQRASAEPADRLPWMLLLLDRWEGFVAAYENYDYGRLVDTVVRLLREGPAVGLRAIVTGDRSVLSGQISTVFERRLVLRMSEPTDYGYAGINERKVPRSMPPGRAVEQAGAGDTLIESQVALLDPDPSGAAQVAALRRIARAAPPPRRSRPLRVDDLPAEVTATDLDHDLAPSSPLWALIGAGGDELGPVGVDLLTDGPGFTVAGPARSGRSTALLTMAGSLLARDVPLVLVTPRRSPLRELAGRPGVLAVLDGEVDPAALDEVVREHPRHALIVDDVELVAGTALDDALDDALRRARDGDHAVVVAGTGDDLKAAYRGVVATALRSRSGLLLAVRGPEDGDLLGVRLPRGAGGGPVGRAVLVRVGAPQPVQVAVPG